ncbi:MAG: hypothetical protein D6704_04785 [Nitrospirae bacterium]|nr:MAG: hypothetical protein D6704_04785 [Nitrospirota bacterium]
MDTSAIDRVIIQQRVVDRLPPRLLATEALDWRINEPETLSRLCIVPGEWEEAVEIRRTADLGLLPVLIVEDMRERDWRAWQREWGLPPFLIGFFLQDGEDVEQMIRGPGTQLFRRLARGLAAEEQERIGERSETMRAIERALGAALGGWSTARQGPMKDQLAKVFAEELQGKRAVIAQEALMNGDPLRWRAFEGGWFDGRQRSPGGLFALMRDVGIDIVIGQGNVTYLFQATQVQLSRRESCGVVVGLRKHTQADNDRDWETKIDEQLQQLPRKTGTYRGGNEKPAFCWPEFDDRGCCKGMRLRMPDDVRPGSSRVEIKVNGKLLWQEKVVLESIGESCCRFDFQSGKAEELSWDSQRTIKSSVSSNGNTCLKIDISTEDAGDGRH